MKKTKKWFLVTEEEYNNLLDIEKNTISFIDNNKEDMLVNVSWDWKTIVRLFGKTQFEELCEHFFWHESWFISSLLKELDERTMKEIVYTYQYNIWFNEWAKHAMHEFNNQMKTLLEWQDNDVMDDIIKEYNIPKWKEEEAEENK